MTRITCQRGAGSRPRRLAAAAALLALVAGTVVLSGCGPSQTPETIIIAATATANEPEPGLSSDIQALLESAGADSADATAYIVDPATSQPTKISLTARIANGQVDYGPTRSQNLAANVAAVERILGQEAATGPFDLLNSIAAAVRVAPAPATLIVLSSGLSTSGGLDMRQAGWELSPESVAAQLKAHGLLPNLTGYRVIFSGLADTAGRQPTLSLPQRQILIAYWMAICTAGGAVSCSADEMTRPDPPSRSSVPVPMVPVLAVRSIVGHNGTTTTAVPDALLFQFNSSVLLPDADSVLLPIVTRARSHHLLVSVTGYASPDGGSAAYNKGLSERRAQAVSLRLRALKLPADQILKVIGAGTGGEPASACIVSGQLDEAVCALLRRVTITMSPTTASAQAEASN